MPKGLVARHLDPNRAAWIAETDPPRPAPPLRAATSSEIVVIGGGLTGVSTAWHLSRQRPGTGIMLLEAEVLGNGASGRNGGQVLNGINGVGTHDPERLRRLHATTRLGIDIAEELARRHAPPGTFRRQGCIEVYTDAARAEAAHAYAEELGRAGIPVRFLGRGALGLPPAHGAILDPLAGRMNAFALLQAMRPALAASGVVVHEHTPVLRVREGRTITVTTPGGEVRAGAIVLATNAYTPRLGYFRSGILPLHSHVLATEPLSAETFRRIGWEDWDGFTDDLDRIAYACRTPGGRLVFGGGGNPAYSYRFGGSPVFPDDARHRAWTFLRNTMLRYFPGLAATPITHRWSGTLAITLDRVCAMGARGRHRNVYYALGYSGHGLALALLAGRVLADLHAGNHEAWRDLPFYQRRLRPMPPEPLRWLGYQAYTRVTGRSPRRSA
jgi:glycine/D-amino acid oxidase-like deaminating enzyme